MRVTDTQFNSMMSRAMMDNNVSINKVAEQIATGNKINHLSDDPIASYKLQGLEKTIASALQSQKNIASVQSGYAQYETYMTSFNDVAMDVSDLLLQAQNSTLDPEAMAGIVTELEALKNEALSLLNKQSDGVYLFSGTDVNTPAIETTPPYAFLGNDEQRFTKVDADTTIANNVTAQDMLAGSSEFFNAIDAAIAEIKNPTGDYTQTLASAIDVAQSTQRDVMNSVAVLGANDSTLDRMLQNSIDTEHYATTLHSSIQELDYVEALVRLEQSMLTLKAAQSTFMTVMNSPTLFDLM